MREVSQYPFSLIDNDFPYKDLISKTMSSLAGIQPEPFGFNPANSGAYRGDALRKIYPINEILKKTPSIKDEILRWARLKVPIFLGEIYRRMFDASFRANATGFGLTLRVRIIEDDAGYSLPPHRDSPDTLFAFLLQLQEENATTSGFVLKERGVRFSVEGEINKAMVHENTAKAIANVFNYRPNLRWTENQFNNRLIAWEPSGDVWIVSIQDKEAQIYGYKEINFNVPFGCLLAIHNPDGSFLFESDASREHALKACHGVAPRVLKARRLLLFDLLGNKTDGDFLGIEGMGTDPNSYYVSFRQETTATMLKQSGFLKD